jgi:hypothetical protein
MTPTLSTEAAGKLLVSIFNALYSPSDQHDFDENTLATVKNRFEMAGFTVEFPLQIKLADDYANIFTHIIDNVSIYGVQNFAAEKSNKGVYYAASLGAAGSKDAFLAVKPPTCASKIESAKTVLDAMQNTGIFKIGQNFIPIIR